MAFFSTTSKKKNIELICDISNGSIGVALVEYGSSSQPDIVFVERSYVDSKNISNTENHLNILTKEFSNALSSVLNHCIKISKKPSHISCFYSSPWFISQTHILKSKQIEPALFTEKTLEIMLKGGEDNFFSSKMGDITPLSAEGLRLIERRITKIKLNGYETHNPFGKEASLIDISVFLSAIAKDTFNSVEDSIRRFWGLIPIEHHTFSLASFGMIKNIANTFGSFVVVQVFDDVTDVLLVNDGVLLDTVSFPFGKKTFINRISKDCNLDHEISSSVFDMYIKDETHFDEKLKYEKSIESSKKDWFSHFEHACSLIFKNTQIPPVVYLISKNMYIAFFESIIKGGMANSFSFAGKDFQIFPINKDSLDSYVKYSYSKHKDFFIETEAFYLNLISGIENIKSSNYVIE